MEYVNGELKRMLPLGAGALMTIPIPETYFADSIADYLRDRDGGVIKPTRKILPFGVFFRNLSLVRFQGVLFGINDGQPYLSDLEDCVDVEVKKRGKLSHFVIGHSEGEIDRIMWLKGKRADEAVTFHNHSDGRLYLGSLKVKKNSAK